MIEEQGRVVTAKEGVVWIETLRNSTCTSCSARQGCGQHLSEKYKTSSVFAYIMATSEWSLSEGDRVIVGIPERSLIKASVLVYLLPLVTMMTGLWLSSAASAGDAVTLLATAAGLLLGFIPARRFGHKKGYKKNDICPVKVVQVLSRQDSAIESLSIRNA